MACEFAKIVSLLVEVKSTFLSHGEPPASPDFWEKKLLRFIDPFTATRDPIKGLNVYIGHIV